MKGLHAMKGNRSTQYSDIPGFVVYICTRASIFWRFGSCFTATGFLADGPSEIEPQNRKQKEGFVGTYYGRLLDRIVL